MGGGGVALSVTLDFVTLDEVELSNKIRGLLPFIKCAASMAQDKTRQYLLKTPGNLLTDSLLK